MDLISCKAGMQKSFHVFQTLDGNLLRLENMNDVYVAVFEVIDDSLLVHTLILTERGGCLI